jgi:opacity protein-like surface antigen
MKSKIILFVLFVLTVSSIGAQTLSIGPQVGFLKSTDADKAVVMPALAARLDLLNIGIEGSIGYKSEEYGDGMIKTTSYPVLLTGMLGVFPFIHAEAGIGWYNTKIEYKDALVQLGAKDETKQEIGYHIGAGAEIPLGNAILTGDLRYVFLDVDFNNTQKLFETKSNYYTICIGLLFKL